MSTVVPTDPGLMGCLGLQLLITRAEAATRFPGVELDSLPPDARLFQVGLGGGVYRLVAHHGTGASEVWEVWEADPAASYWCQLNEAGRPL